MTDIENEDPVLSRLKAGFNEMERAAEEHEKLRNSAPYQAEIEFLKNIVHNLIRTLHLSQMALSRAPANYSDSMLVYYFDDIAEAAITVKLAIENGALNPARRELRYMLEVAVNTAYVDEVKGDKFFDERVNFFKSKKVTKRNIDNISELPIRLLPDNKKEFMELVKNAWINASNYVHPTKRRMQEKLDYRQQGISLGLETLEMLRDIVAEVFEVFTIVLALVFETIGPSLTGDLLVDNLDKVDAWQFHKSQIMAVIDAEFDYKHERKHRLQNHIERREKRIVHRVFDTKTETGNT